MPLPEPVVADPRPLSRRAILRQRWTELAYFHWAYDPSDVQRLLPAGVTVDTFDGTAWVGLIPFVMRDVQLGPAPAIPYLGTFVEINVRTYVVDPLGRRSVWFFSLDVPRSVIVAVARSFFALPYCWSGTEFVADGDRRRYRMDRRWPRGTRATADIEFTIGARLPDAEIGALDHFLSARWSLLTARRRGLRYGRVHHQRWPLHRIDDFVVEQDVIQAAGLPSPLGPPRVLASPGVDVGLAWLESVPRRA